MSNSTLKILPALIAAITAVLVTQSVYGVPDHQMVFTENSSSSLSVTYDGPGGPITVANVSPDVWSVTIPNTIATGSELGWVEPENPNLGNDFNFNSMSETWLLTSEFIIPTGTTFAPDGFTFVGWGGDFRDFVAIDVTFHDHGDGKAVPDTGTTGSLFALSLMGLAFLRRKILA